MDKHLSVVLTRLGQNITRIRKEKGLSQVELAHEMNMDRSNLRRIEAGRTSPTVTTLFRISKVLKVNVEDLFYEELPPTEE